METGLVSVDRWGKESQAYFLTHLHSDHTAGLSSRWSRGPLYCSPISARLLPSRFPGFDLTLLRILEVGSTHSISLTSPTTGSEVHVKVTSIDAHHCPGAVMYLFRGEFGCVLHTGDFRWEAKCERDQLGKQMLLDALDGDRVDVLHLDNTYCHHSFSFPPREVAAQQIPVVTSFAVPDRPREIRMQAAFFIQQLCQSSPLTLQMFMPCRGIPVLVGFLEADYAKYSDTDGNINIFPLLKRIVQNNVPVCVYSGDQDSVVPLLGSRTLVRELAQEVSKAEGRIAQTTDVVIGGTVTDDATNEWLELDQKAQLVRQLQSSPGLPMFFGTLAGRRSDEYIKLTVFTTIGFMVGRLIGFCLSTDSTTKVDFVTSTVGFNITDPRLNSYEITNASSYSGLNLDRTAYENNSRFNTDGTVQISNSSCLNSDGTGKSPANAEGTRSVKHDNPKAKQLI